MNGAGHMERLRTIGEATGLMIFYGCSRLWLVKGSDKDSGRRE